MIFVVCTFWLIYSVAPFRCEKKIYFSFLFLLVQRKKKIIENETVANRNLHINQFTHFLNKFYFQQPAVITHVAENRIAYFTKIAVDFRIFCFLLCICHPLPMFLFMQIVHQKKVTEWIGWNIVGTTKIANK